MVEGFPIPIERTAIHGLDERHCGREQDPPHALHSGTGGAKDRQDHPASQRRKPIDRSDLQRMDRPRGIGALPGRCEWHDRAARLGLRYRVALGRLGHEPQVDRDRAREQRRRRGEVGHLGCDPRGGRTPGRSALSCLSSRASGDEQECLPAFSGLPHILSRASARQAPQPLHGPRRGVLRPDDRSRTPAGRTRSGLLRCRGRGSGGDPW